MKPKYPNITVKLVGEDGNAFGILGRCRSQMRAAQLSQEEIEVDIQGYSAWRLPMDVDFSIFDRLEVFVRGDTVLERSRRNPWLSTGRPPRRVRRKKAVPDADENVRQQPPRPAASGLPGPHAMHDLGLRERCISSGRRNDHNLPVNELHRRPPPRAFHPGGELGRR